MKFHVKIPVFSDFSRIRAELETSAVARIVYIIFYYLHKTHILSLIQIEHTLTRKNNDSNRFTNKFAFSE